jgi:hypothetical protein
VGESILNETGLAGAEAAAAVTVDASSTPVAPSWETWREVFGVVSYPPFLKKTVRISVVVGSILFLVNHLDEVALGRATPSVWIKGLVTYLVPFCVSNFGVLVASRRPRTRQ